MTSLVNSDCRLASAWALFQTILQMSSNLVGSGKESTNVVCFHIRFWARVTMSIVGLSSNTIIDRDFRLFPVILLSLSLLESSIVTGSEWNCIAVSEDVVDKSDAGEKDCIIGVGCDGIWGVVGESNRNVGVVGCVSGLKWVWESCQSSGGFVCVDTCVVRAGWAWLLLLACAICVPRLLDLRRISAVDRFFDTLCCALRATSAVDFFLLSLGGILKAKIGISRRCRGEIVGPGNEQEMTPFHGKFTVVTVNFAVKWSDPHWQQIASGSDTLAWLQLATFPIDHSCILGLMSRLENRTWHPKLCECQRRTYATSRYIWQYSLFEEVNFTVNSVNCTVSELSMTTSKKQRI